MFYSHEVLTSRKYGVATIWLVATLGSASKLKKVNRRAILDVDVPKACETIITPEAPLALRLQGNLLYGVSRVYAEQCGYILQDAQTAQNSMRALLSVTNAANVDPPQGHAQSRPDQLVLLDDPAFMPDLAFTTLDFDLTHLDATTSAGSQASSALSPNTGRTTPFSQHSQDLLGGLIFPSSVSGGGGAPFGFEASDRFSKLGRDDLPPIVGDDDGFLPDPDFTFDAEGNMIDLTEQKATAAAVRGPVVPERPSAGLRVGGASAHRGNRAGQDDYMIPMDDELPIDATAFDVPARPLGALDRQSESAHPTESQESSSTVAAPQRKRKTRRVLLTDSTIQLHNGELARWNNDYLIIQGAAAKTNMAHMAPIQAKKNAEHWIFGRGLANVGDGIGGGGIATPLEAFTGLGMYKWITGHDLYPSGEKRPHDATTTDTEDQGRRFRRRTGSAEAARHEDATTIFDNFGNPIGFADDDGAIVGLGDVEIGREAPEPLTDHDRSSQMPWNVIGSQHGSSAKRASSTFGLRAGSLPGSVIAGPVSRRASRLVSASPLVGRGLPRPLGGPDPRSGYTGGSDAGGMDIGAFSDQPAESNEFEFYGPAASVDTQTAGQSQWQRAALDVESDNFLVYVEEAVVKKKEDGEEEPGRVTFEELLPPTSNTRIVAAQALLHVLSLVTKGVLSAEQKDFYGEIAIELTDIAV